MSTPLYKSFKTKGTTFYTFPSTSADPNPNFSKFVLLHIPAKVNNKVLDFDESGLNGNNFDIYTQSSDPTATYGEQMIESLRNYVANYDTVIRESRITTRTDFYNINEDKTPTEKIFWKWLRKFGAIDFEPAVHKTDWDKNLSDFENPNADTISNTDYFRKYLWKEREVVDYSVSTVEYKGDGGALSPALVGSSIVKIFIDYLAKFKVGDYVLFTENTTDGLNGLLEDTPYEVLRVDESSTMTILYVNASTVSSTDTSPDGNVTLDYQRVVNYVGEINAKSEVHTATKDETEVTAYLPHQAGKTPTILFEIDDDTNYYPGLEIPILSEQIQPEISGAENYNSPIRQNPSEYPGLYYGQFDTTNKTYYSSSGDKLRYNGDYYGIDLSSNIGLDDEDYIEYLSIFNSDNIDGVSIDFDLNHYYKMSITDDEVGFNFDEFSQLVINNTPPEDFYFNAILWYYEKEGDDGTIYTNLYGIEFLNNPDNDDDTNDSYITPYEKLVSTDSQDGISYQHVLNLSNSVDNDTSSLSFDSMAINNLFGFDLYSNVMSNVGKLNEQFVNIINEFVRLNDEMKNVRSLVYSQTDINLIKSKLKNLEELLQLYSQYQFVETESVKIDTDYSGVYPTLGFNVVGIEYGGVISLKTSEIYDASSETETTYPVTVPDTNRLYLRITNDDIIDYRGLSIEFNQDLGYKQILEIDLVADDAYYNNEIKFYIDYNDGSGLGSVKTLLMEDIYLPSDIGILIPNDITYSRNKYLSDSIFQFIKEVQVSEFDSTSETVLYTNGTNLFGNDTYNEKVYIKDLKFLSGETLLDYSGVYTIETTSYTTGSTTIVLDTYGLTPVGTPTMYTYKGLKIKVMRISSSSTSTLVDRYLIEKTYI